MRCRDPLRFALTSPADSASSLSNGCTSNCATTASTNTRSRCPARYPLTGTQRYQLAANQG
jgi:hypothetical protein